MTLVEPQGYSTDWGGPSAIQADQLPAYDGVREKNAKRRGSSKPGDPDASGPAILKLVDAEEPPLRCFFGANAFDMVRPDYESRLATWEEWDWLAKEAHGDALSPPCAPALSRWRPPTPPRPRPSQLCWDGPGRRVRSGSVVRPSGSRSTCRRRDRRSPRTS